MTTLMTVRFLVDKELMSTLRLSESFFVSADYSSLLCSHRDQCSLLPLFDLHDLRAGPHFGRCGPLTLDLLIFRGSFQKLPQSLTLT